MGLLGAVVADVFEDPVLVDRPDVEVRRAAAVDVTHGCRELQAEESIIFPAIRSLLDTPTYLEIFAEIRARRN